MSTGIHRCTSNTDIAPKSLRILWFVPTQNLYVFILQVLDIIATPYSLVFFYRLDCENTARSSIELFGVTSLAVLGEVSLSKTDLVYSLGNSKSKINFEKDHPSDYFISSRGSGEPAFWIQSFKSHEFPMII